MFSTTHHCFAEVALTADTVLGICDAEEHYLESTGLQPASFKLWPKLIKQVVKAGYTSGPAFIFVLTALSPFHYGQCVSV